MQTQANGADSTHVSVEDLSIAYRTSIGREKLAVSSVGFRLQRGDTLGIVGESGSGKSTVARALLGLVRPGAHLASGRVVVGGHDILHLPERHLRHYRGGVAAMVPQNPLSSLTPHLTVGAQLLELVRLHGGLRGKAARERALSLMEGTGLPGPASLFTRYPHELSGGQRQRVVIAAALAGEPELIVLDEPTTALDKTVEAQVLDLIGEIQQRSRTTLVYVSHDLNVIARMCRRVLVMRGGEIVEDGPIATIFERPRTDYARALIRAIPRLQAPAAISSVSAQGAPVLQVRGLSFTHGRSQRRWLPLPPVLRHAAKTEPTLADIALEIAPGATLGVVGESGSGKSTLASLIAGALSGYDGEVLFQSTPLAEPATRRTPDLRRRVQMVFQDPLSSLNPQHSVEEIITRPLRIFMGLSRAAARAHALPMLDELELSPDLLSRSPRQLSGGQQQRVAVARAIVDEPALVLADEPRRISTQRPPRTSCSFSCT